MKLIVIAGFLGTGKTTLILSVARALVNERKKKVVIIENEIGEIGIDHQYLAMEGLKVKEIQAGCICCELSYNLLDTLEKIEYSFHPDVVIIEASGVANPEKIIQAIERSKLPIDQKKVVVLIDARRFKAIMALQLPFVQGGFRVADLIAINKIDAVQEKDLDTLTHELKNLVSHTRILPISATQGYAFNELMQWIQ